MRTRHHRGFTLIEILVVITIIALLGGMVLRLGNLVYQKIARAKEASRIEHLRLCLEEYYKAYGIYPPTGSMSYISPVDGRFPEDWERIVRAGRRNDPNFNRAASTGLIYFVMASGANFTSDHAPENTAWHEYWENVGAAADLLAHTNQFSPGYGRYDYSNYWYSVLDSWLHEYRYVSTHPYQSYRLWSVGPDGRTWDPDSSTAQNKDRVADDVGFDAWVE